VSYALTTTVQRSFADTLDATRVSLTDQGFGVLTEIDIQATLKAKLNVDIPAQVILGACRPPLAHVQRRRPIPGRRHDRGRGPRPQGHGHPDTE
jgi:hypothetical protein